MIYETKRRSILKAISWRTWATLTTALLVFIFTGKFVLAITVGALEVLIKMVLYFFHERLWEKIRYGRKEIPPFVLWLTGLPASGKKAVGDAVHKALVNERLKVERLDSSDIRHLFPDVGFSPEEVDYHVRRAGHLVAMLERNGVCVVFSSVSPFRESRRFARKLARNFVEVYLKTTPEACERRDAEGHYRKARAGEYQYFPGVDGPYEVPLNPEMVVEVDSTTSEEAARQIVHYLKTHVLYGKKAPVFKKNGDVFSPDQSEAEQQ